MKTHIQNSIFLFLGLILNFQTFHAQSTIEIYALATSFNPQNVTINAGDTIRWINNSSELHNVNGTTISYPSNPESFGNSLGLAWTYAHKFNIPGNYNYRCNEHYSMGMTGSITVLPSSELTEQEKLEKLILIYPNPAEYNFTIINNSGLSFSDFEMYSTSGKSILKVPFTDNVDLPDLENGIYYLKLSGENNSITKMVIIE